MDKVLLPNPEGCTEFARHQFKKDRCKNCGKRWQEHLGVISDELVTEFLLAQKSAEDRRQREEEEAKLRARAKVRAKRKAKKKQERAVEDDWFFSGSEGTMTSEDDNVGFQMMQGGDSGASAAPTNMNERRKSFDKGKQPRVVNLIDFTECDIPDEPALGIVDNPATSSSADPLMTPAVMRVPISGPGPGLTVLSEEGVTILAEEQLLAEIEHLRQRLKDADAERSVQISIVRDEVEEKERIIEELEQKRRDAETNLEEALAQVEKLRQERDAAAVAAAAAQEAARARKEAAAAEAARQGPLQQELEEAEPGAVLGRGGFAAAFGCTAAGLDPAELEAALEEEKKKKEEEEEEEEEDEEEEEVTKTEGDEDESEEVTKTEGDEEEEAEEASQQPRVQEPAEAAEAEAAEAQAAEVEAAEAQAAEAEAAEAQAVQAAVAENEVVEAEAAEAQAAEAQAAEAEAAEAEAPEEEIEAVKPQTAEPELRLQPREKGFLWTFLEQQYWFKCLRPNTLDSDPD